eukprot:GAHX01005510.1.p2 GENE.GAHX01005510.1~~GAHX01005510.1.p2  ORF type:complete len:56 (+),score=3.25 GAHX01005510.1:76-243(+)
MPLGNQDKAVIRIYTHGVISVTVLEFRNDKMNRQFGRSPLVSQGSAGVLRPKCLY